MRYKYLHRFYLETDGLSCLSRNVVIPKTINGVQVTSIGDLSFHSPPSEPGPAGTPDPLNFLESVSIPEGITTIKAGAFAYGRLKSVNIPSSVTSIDPSAFSLQSPYGSSIVSELWSGDPVRAQAAYKTINYVQLVLADPSNPHGLMSASDTWEYLQDFNGNSQTDDYIITGGHIIGASPVQLNFQDGSGNQLQPSQLITGETADGTQLTSFLVADAPLPPVPSTPMNPWDPPTQEELQAISDFLESTFFTNGRTFSYNAPVINGITPTPSSFNGQLASGLNNINFIYATSSADNPESPTSGGTTSSGLADTGVNVWAAFTVGGVMLLASGVLLVRQRSS